MKIIVVPCEDGPYYLVFRVPEGMSMSEADKIISDATDKMYSDESIDDAMDWLFNYLASKDIHEAEWQLSRGSF